MFTREDGCEGLGDGLSGFQSRRTVAAEPILLNLENDSAGVELTALSAHLRVLGLEIAINRRIPTTAKSFHGIADLEFQFGKRAANTLHDPVVDHFLWLNRSIDVGAQQGLGPPSTLDPLNHDRVFAHWA